MKVESLEKKVEDLFLQVSSLPEDEVKSRLSEYLCIRASGLLENIVKQLVHEYMSTTTPKEVQDYVNSKLRSLTNLDHNKIKAFLFSFSKEWHDEYDSYVTTEVAESLNSIYGLRNSLAHGGTNPVSYKSIKEHYENMKIVILALKIIISKNKKIKKSMIK
ncbi:HEPN domain-containing protein [Fibrella aquatica]|uniref:HEPN domain-containing protein n=1 Tax=Fibrella aquatica TaxID=3242487 RepID=UPI003521FB69